MPEEPPCVGASSQENTTSKMSLPDEDGTATQRKLLNRVSPIPAIPTGKQSLKKQAAMLLVDAIYIAQKREKNKM